MHERASRSRQPISRLAPSTAWARGARGAVGGALGLVALASCGCDWILDIDKDYGLAPVNRVQPGALDKSFFVGDDYEGASDDPEFLWQPTVLDAGSAAGVGGLFTSGAVRPAARVRWEITEDLLLARAKHGRLDSAGDSSDACGTDEIIVGAFRIDAHFDIKHDETQNLVLEAQERQWFKRQYIRVDWSRNLASDCTVRDLAERMGFGHGVGLEPMELYVNNPDDPSAPHFDFDRGYFDITTRVFAKPTNAFPDADPNGLQGGILPFCDLHLTPAPNATDPSCYDPAELEIRTSFVRVEGDFAAEEWDVGRSRAFGASTAWVKGQFPLQTTVLPLTAHPSIWEHPHAYADPQARTGEVPCSTTETTTNEGPHRDLNDDGTEDECAAVGPGATCDVVASACTLPLAQREVKPIAWFFTESLAEEHFGAVREAVHQWDVALRAAVLSGRAAECVRTGGADCAARFPGLTGRADDAEDAIALAREVDDCRAFVTHSGEDCDALAGSLAKARGVTPGVLALATMPEIAVLCHSPVESGDPAACGEDRLPDGISAADCAEATGTESTLKKTCDEHRTVRRGDLRDNQIVVLTGDEGEIPWSQSTAADDPLTGERVSSTITVWAQNIAAWSERITDRARFVAGELPLASVTDAEAADGWLGAAAEGGRGTLGTMTDHELIRRASAITGAEAWGDSGIDEQALTGVENDAALRERLVAEAARVGRVRADAASQAPMDPLLSDRMDALAYTDVETELMTKTLQELAGVYGQPMTDSILEISSPLRAMDRRRWRRAEHARDVALAGDGGCVALEPPPPASPAVLAGMLVSKFGPFDPESPADEQQARAARMRGYLTRRMIEASILHQMGHALGLGHDLAASADAANYPPQYWQLRTKNGAVTAPCADRSATGEDCTGPRYFDPVTEEERAGLMGMFAQGSVMDMTGDATTMLLGLGAHDFAATALIHGGVAQVHARPGEGVGTARGRGEIEAHGSSPGVLGLRTMLGSDDGKTAREIPYAEIQKRYEVLDPASCHAVDPQALRPAAWDEARLGTFHPVLDGHVVTVGGKPTRCRQSPVDVVPWRSLRAPKIEAGEAAATYDGGPAIDRNGRVRVAYRSATDTDAGAGNPGADREDAGADAYEMADHLVTEGALDQIFDAHGRGRAGLGALGTARLRFARSMEALRNGVKGPALLRRRIEEIAAEPGIAADPAVLWSYSSRRIVAPQVLAAAAAMDQITGRITAPQPGEHLRPKDDTVLRSRDLLSKPDASPTLLVVPNGAASVDGLVAPGGQEIAVHFTSSSAVTSLVSAGAYFDKAFGPLLLTETDDSLAESTVDTELQKLRSALSPADMFPDGYRRFLANALTSDDTLKGLRVASDAAGKPLVGAAQLPKGGLGFTSYWAPRPEVCFPGGGGHACAEYGAPESLPLDPALPANVAIVDPSVGWEQQKFLIVWAYVFLPREGQSDWLDLLEVDELGSDGKPAYPARIELHIPNEKDYVARTFGTETLFGQTVQRGIGARVLEQANQLASEAYEGQWQTGPDGVTQWFVTDLDPDSGDPIIVSQEKADAFQKQQSVVWLLARMRSWAVKNENALY